MLWQIASILCVCIIRLFCFVVFFCQSVGSLSRHIDSKQLSYTHEHSSTTGEARWQDAFTKTGTFYCKPVINILKVIYPNHGRGRGRQDRQVQQVRRDDRLRQEEEKRLVRQEKEKKLKEEKEKKEEKAKKERERLINASTPPTGDPMIMAWKFCFEKTLSSALKDTKIRSSMNKIGFYHDKNPRNL